MEKKTKENTLTGEDAVMVAALIRYGYTHAINELKKWIDEAGLPTYSFITHGCADRVRQRLSDMSTKEKKHINAEMLQQEIDEMESEISKHSEKYLVMRDNDNSLFIWTQQEYDNYVSKATSVGAAPAFERIISFYVKNR